METYFIPRLILFLSIVLVLVSSSSSSSSSTTTTTTTLKPSSSLRSTCEKTPYPETCLETLKLSVSVTIGLPQPEILSLLLKSLETAISEATKLSTLLSTAGLGNNLVENRRGAIQDCKDLHRVTLNSLTRSLSKLKNPNPNNNNNNNKKSHNNADARAYLSAALTNKRTCLESLESASGPLKSTLVDSLNEAYKQVSNSLSMVPKGISNNNRRRRRLLNYDFPIIPRRRVLLESGYDSGDMITVAQDGSGNLSTISEAVSLAPNNSFDRFIIYVKEGVYEENVEIPSFKTNLVLIGDGSDVTFITGNRSVGTGWTTFRSATLAVSGEGFLARDITIENTAGPENRQAAALRVNADFAAFFRCAFSGDQDTLYVHSFRQFYRECDIYGTIDFIFGNAAVVFQNCDVVSKLPLAGQFTVVTAQSRETPDEDTGMSFQNCSVISTEDLFNATAAGRVVRSYLGRPWREFARTVFLESYIDGFIDPSGWSPWSSGNNQGLDTLYYGEYNNYGPGSGTENRITWPGFHVMAYEDAANFTVSELITGYAWLDSTSFPYNDGV